MSDGPSEPTFLEVSRDDIIRMQSLQGRTSLHLPAIRQYANALKSGNKLPPIEVGRIGDRLYLLDGWHRVAAAEEVGEQHIRAVVRDFTNMRGLTLAAATVNTAHGVQLKTKDHQRRLAMFIGARGHRKADGSLMSYREIAAALGGTVAYTTVRNWIIKHHPKVAAQMSEPSRDASPTWEWSPPERKALRKQVAQSAKSVLGAVRALHLVDAAAAREELQSVLEELTETLERIISERPLQRGTPPTAVANEHEPSPGLVRPAPYIQNDDF